MKSYNLFWSLCLFVFVLSSTVQVAGQSILFTPFTNCIKLNQTCSDLKNSGNNTSGTYTVGMSNGGTTTIYCDMTTDGGGWTLTARWKLLNSSWAWHQVAGLTSGIRTVTNDVPNKPVPPDGVICPFGTTALVKPGHPTFIAHYGTWFRFALGAFNNATLNAPVYYSSISGGAGATIISSNSRALWNTMGEGNVNGDGKEEGIFPGINRDQICGGPSRAGNAVCVCLVVGTYPYHCDLTYDKEVYRK